jgi:transposase
MTIRRYEISDFEWSIIEPLLPNKPRGVARVDDRKVLNGVYWRLRTGSPWADIPERYGPLRANDDETRTAGKFTLEGVKGLHRSCL